MLKRLIRLARRQPKAVRETIALWVAGCFTFMVVAVWAYHLPSRISESNGVVADEGLGIGRFFSNIKEQMAAATNAAPASTTTATTSGQISFPAGLKVSTTSVSRTPVATRSTTTPTAATSSTEEFVEPEEPRPIRIVTVSGSSTTATATPPIE